MITNNIHNQWGTVIEFSTPMDFFSYPPSYWRDQIYSRKLLIFKRMSFSLLDYMKFSYYFGKPWSIADYSYSNEIAIIETDPDGNKHVSSIFSNKIVSKKKIGLEDMPWHADIPNRKERSFPHRSLWIVKNPNSRNSGKTRWLNINLNQCAEFLDSELLGLIGRVTIKQQSWYKPGTDLQMHNLVKIHPITGEKSLRLNYYCNPKIGINNAWIKEVYIDNVLQPDCSLIKRYVDALVQHEELLYVHTWDDYDIAIYDNYPFIHGRSAIILDETQSLKERTFYRTNIDHSQNF